MITSGVGLSPALRRTTLFPRLARLQGTNAIAKRSIQTSSVLKKRLQFPNNSRRPKSGSQWTLQDLQLYNIHLHEQDALTFFGVKQLPEPAVDPEVLHVTDPFAMQKVPHSSLLHHLNRHKENGSEAAVVDFSDKLFDIMGYATHDSRGASAWPSLRFCICGEDKNAATDICIVAIDYSRNFENILLVQEIRQVRDRKAVDGQAQLVAEAVAAFTENNVKRTKAGLEPVSQQVMPGIFMVGTSPTFFKIPVSETLLTHIRHGTYPPDATIVTFCQPPVPRRSEWMTHLDARRQILSCYEAFKKVMGI